MRKISLNFLATFVIGVSVFGIIINIIHFFEIRATETINFDYVSQLSKLRENLSYSEEVITKINTTTNQSKISIEDFNSLKKDINACLRELEGLKVLKYHGRKTINNQEKYQLLTDASANSCISLIGSSKIIEIYDPTTKGLANMMAANTLSGMYGTGLLFNNLNSSYQYILKDHFSSIINMSESVEVMMIVSYSNSNVSNLNYIANWLFKEMVGGKNE